MAYLYSIIKAKEMKTKIQIKTFLGKMLFEYEKENNSIKKTLIKAVIQGAYLQGADLRDADLRDANLRGADLQGANLQGADLQGADLRDADIQGAYLPIYCKYHISIIDDKIKMGCKIKSIKEWNDIFKRSEFQSEVKGNIDSERIYANYKAVKAYYLHMKNLKVK